MAVGLLGARAPSLGIAQRLIDWFCAALLTRTNLAESRPCNPWGASSRDRCHLGNHSPRYSSMSIAGTVRNRTAPAYSWQG
eukprot:scaffold8_cov249-Pinguiococcus_pyrenoidosus.AAC.13